MKKLNKILLELYNDRKQILFLSFLGYISYLIQDLIPSDPHANMAIIPYVLAGAKILGGKRQRKDARRESALAREERAKQQAILEKQKQEYRDIEFTNPYEGMQNQYAENVYEDLTVNQQQAQFQAQQGAQQRANIMGGLRGAAGTSGIAGLAQAMANQGQIQAQQISGSIGMQEARNQQLRAQGDQQRQRGAAAVDLQMRTGDQMLQEAESGRQATLLGVDLEGAAGANKSYQQQLKNQALTNESANQMQQSGYSDLYDLTK